MTITMIVVNIFTCIHPHKSQSCFLHQTSQAFHSGLYEVYDPYIQHGRELDLNYEHPGENENEIISTLSS